MTELDEDFERTVILELGSVKALKEVVKTQLTNYLELSGIPVGDLMDFCTPRAEWKRFVDERRPGQAA